MDCKGCAFNIVCFMKKLQEKYNIDIYCPCSECLVKPACSSSCIRRSKALNWSVNNNLDAYKDHVINLRENNVRRS